MTAHDATVNRRGGGWGFRCTCGEAPNRSTRQRRIAEGWADTHVATASQDAMKATADAEAAVEAADEQFDADVEALGFIAGGAALRAEVENDLEERGLIVQTDEPYANLTEAGRDLLAESGETVYVCAAGHRFTKRMRRYADCYCPRCGCNDVAWDAEP